LLAVALALVACGCDDARTRAIVDETVRFLVQELRVRS